MSDDLIPAGQHDNPALADPELRAVIGHPEPDALPRITVLAAELVARHTGVQDEPPVAAALAALRRSLPGTARDEDRSELTAALTTLADTLKRRTAEAPNPVEIGPTASPAERLYIQMQAVRAIAGALDPDPTQAAWNVCWTAGYAIGRNFDDQLRLVVLDRCRDRATRSRSQA